MLEGSGVKAKKENTGSQMGHTKKKNSKKG